MSHNLIPAHLAVDVTAVKLRMNPDNLPTEYFTQSGVRMRRHRCCTGPLNWLLLPGGPGIGSESLHELSDILDVPGTIWMVDLPGDGSNVAPPTADKKRASAALNDETHDLFEKWPNVFIEAADAA